MSVQMMEGRQALAEDLDDAEYIGRLLASTTDPEFTTISFLGVFTRGAVFVQQLGRDGCPAGSFAVLPADEFKDRFTPAAQ
ncbi:hypothetical protein SAMN05660473_00177 [Arthrobacter sp. 49Tsu3.1M3]|jgi:hypothetical protein|uniref:hypothetical protein n=1 Tax=Arthrobacter sp. 49Tsu3.1M3 TaxID=1279029 RepID=UPI0009A8AC65|nr:hypothetical protein [Arthrobacter sp. 49Tsu3.1M3]SKB33810.1 hypothetical protein SAMN05660473_00177 [Arthrobacter sp. 49Tsu3.1M3]